MTAKPEHCFCSQWSILSERDATDASLKISSGDPCQNSVTIGDKCPPHRDSSIQSEISQIWIWDHLQFRPIEGHKKCVPAGSWFSEKEKIPQNSIWRSFEISQSDCPQMPPRRSRRPSHIPILFERSHWIITSLKMRTAKVPEQRFPPQAWDFENNSQSWKFTVRI
jgi:hypothetical protein